MLAMELSEIRKIETSLRQAVRKIDPGSELAYCFDLPRLDDDYVLSIKCLIPMTCASESIYLRQEYIDKHGLDDSICIAVGHVSRAIRKFNTDVIERQRYHAE